MGQLEMHKINNTAPTLRTSQASRKQKQNKQYRCQYRGQCPGEDTPRCLSAGQGEVLSGEQERIKPGKLPGAADSERSPEGKQELRIDHEAENKSYHICGKQFKGHAVGIRTVEARRRRKLATACEVPRPHVCTDATETVIRVSFWAAGQ